MSDQLPRRPWKTRPGLQVTLRAVAEAAWAWLIAVVLTMLSSTSAAAGWAVTRCS